MTTYIVTGAYGHLGSTITEALLSRGAKVRGLVMQNEKPAISLTEFAGAEIITGDVSDPASMERLFDAEGEKVVIHTAGIVSIANKIDKKIYGVNVLGTQNIIDLCARHGARLVYVSSVHAIPDTKKAKTIKEITRFDPGKVKGAYAKSKAIATQLVMDAAEKGLDACVVMPSGILGPFDSGRNHLVALIKDFLIGKLTSIVKGGYDIVDVRDVAAACINAADMSLRGETFILSNAYCSIKDLCDHVSGLTGVRRIKIILPVWVPYMLSPVLDLYYKLRKVRPLYTAYSLTVVQSKAAFDNSKARKVLNFRPRSIFKSIKDTVNWLLTSCKLTPPKRLIKAVSKA